MRIWPFLYVNLALLAAADLACHAAAAASPAAASPATRPATLEQLLAASREPDSMRAMAAVRELAAGGEPAKATLRDAVRGMLARDRQAIEVAAKAPPDAKKVAEGENRLAELRKATWDNIAKLEKGDSVKLAQANHQSLLEVVGPLNNVYAMRIAVYDAMGRRGELRTIWRKIARPGESLADKDESRLPALAEKALGMRLAEFPPMRVDMPPRDPAQQGFWFFRACRQVESFNTMLMPFVDANEFRCLIAVNRYRECLGIFPLELDPRLVQSARRHSKEMRELNYFSHESPTASEKSPWQRIAGAGYEGGAGENIAYGPTDGDGVFRMWFDSPPHHQIMVARDSTAVGIGRWDNRWTLNTGRGRRVMLMSDAQRSVLSIRGPILPPQQAR